MRDHHLTNDYLERKILCLSQRVSFFQYSSPWSCSPLPSPPRLLHSITSKHHSWLLDFRSLSADIIIHYTHVLSSHRPCVDHWRQLSDVEQRAEDSSGSKLQYRHFTILSSNDTFCLSRLRSIQSVNTIVIFSFITIDNYILLKVEITSMFTINIRDWWMTAVKNELLLFSIFSLIHFIYIYTLFIFNNNKYNAT